MAIQSTDVTTSELIVNQIPQDIYDTKKENGELDAGQLWLTPAAQGEGVVRISVQTLTEEQRAQARENIGALDENIETTPVDTNRTIFGVGKNIVYVKNGWLKPCPADADKELADNYANAVLGFGFINTDISVVKGEAKSAFSLYQQGLISDKGTILKNPLDVAQYITWTVGTTNNKTYIDYRHVEHKGFYEYCRYFEDDTYSYPRASYSLSNDMSDSEPRGSVAQYSMSANPTEDMHVATKQYVDTAKTEAQQLGLTAATPGQIIKVKAVQDGKPTEWEAVDGATWSDIKEKPFGEIGEGLKVDGGKLVVDTTDKIEQDNIKPVTSAAVYTEVGNINAILATI